MYIHVLHCGWLHNPFWRKSFLLAEAVDRDTIRSSVPEITIDLAKGRGLTLTAVTDTSAAPPPATATPRPKRRKPPTGIELAAAIAHRATANITHLFEEARFGRIIRTNDLSPIIDEIEQAMSLDSSAMFVVTRLKNEDQYTYIHSVAVGTLMMGLARHLGLNASDVRIAGMAGLLHDIGKMQIPLDILEKPGRLVPDEMTEMRRHPDLGHAVLTHMGEFDPRILDVCRHHHERMDGTGYPDGLNGDDLSLFARIAMVCDVYDAVTSIRSYKRAWSPHEALAQMLEWEGHFDPHILRAFITTLGIQPFGGLVRLHSNRLAIVIREGPTPTTPIVRAFFDVPDHRLIAIEDVSTTQDAIIRAERGDYWFGENWLSLRSEIMRPPATTDATDHGIPDGDLSSSAVAHRAVAQ